MPCVNRVLGMGANLDYRGEYGLTGLHYAAMSGFEDVVSLLIEKGADINAMSPELGTPLCLAALKSRSNIVALLLKKRALVHTATDYLGTALHCAAWAGDPKTLKLLLEKGAKPQAEEVVHVVRFQSTVAWIDGADASTCLNQQETLLRCTQCPPILPAIYNGNLEVVELLQSHFRPPIRNLCRCRFGLASFDNTPIPRYDDSGSGDFLTLSFLMLAAERCHMGVLRHMINVSCAKELDTDRAVATMIAAARISDRYKRHEQAFMLENWFFAMTKGVADFDLSCSSLKKESSSPHFAVSEVSPLSLDSLRIGALRSEVNDEKEGPSNYWAQDGEETTGIRNPMFRVRGIHLPRSHTPDPSALRSLASSGATFGNTRAFGDWSQSQSDLSQKPFANVARANDIEQDASSKRLAVEAQPRTASIPSAEGKLDDRASVSDDKCRSLQMETYKLKMQRFSEVMRALSNVVNTESALNEIDKIR